MPRDRAPHGQGSRAKCRRSCLRSGSWRGLRATVIALMNSASPSIGMLLLMTAFHACFAVLYAYTWIYCFSGLRLGVAGDKASSHLIPASLTSGKERNRLCGSAALPARAPAPPRLSLLRVPPLAPLSALPAGTRVTVSLLTPRTEACSDPAPLPGTPNAASNPRPALPRPQGGEACALLTSLPRKEAAWRAPKAFPAAATSQRRCVLPPTWRRKWRRGPAQAAAGGTRREGGSGGS